MNLSTLSNIFTIIIACFFLVVSLSLMALAVRNALQHNSRIERRLLGSNGLEAGRFSAPALKPHVLTKLANHLTLPNAEEITRLRFQLSQAGYYDPNAAKKFFAARVLCIVMPQFIIMAVWAILEVKLDVKTMVLIAAFFAVLGLFGPTMFLYWKKTRRTDKCRKGFPDMMDLLVACIEAGLGMDAALIRVGSEIGGRYPPLKINLDIMNYELRAGRLRHEAMIGFAERIDLDEAKALAIMLKQAEEMGSSIGKALRTFSDDMRAKRMLVAEEKAMALSAKLTVPLILFIFPTIMVLILMPAAIRLMEGLG